ncbi:CHC2 zinc finger domain-containing protein [Desulfallas thermosapovorans]|uniref:DNA primase n=1 Tax=Desulfallas thermosapovorans DSM 6562 TaxID=1121431 RepID=A0A5S4ZVM5_9FIRM|nr:CHC2 zinc finger domain-containing protein [Desulfallas thermosapovorans]TYO97044.1 DNA primase [Desulfallas thermosapovorans DSM 6562]
MYAASSVPQSTNIFQLVKQVNIVDVINHYNIAQLHQRGRRWVARCPLHGEKEPSFYVFPDGGWRCFGCGEYGDSTDLVAKVFGLRPIEAARMIARDFGIEVNNKPISLEARRKARQQAIEAAKKREIKQIFNQKRERALEVLSLIVRTTNRALAAGGYKAHYDLAELLHKTDYQEYLIGCLLSNNPDLQLLALTDPEVQQWLE